MRRRINASYPSSYATPTGRPSDLYRRFRKHFSVLLNPDPTNRNFLNRVYVENLAYQQELAEFRSYEEDSFRCLIGLTGIGKTTLLRHVFALAKEVVLDDKCLTVLINPESTARTDSPHTHAAFVFDAACSEIEERFHTKYKDDDLYAFIKDNKRTLLEQSKTKRRQTPKTILNNMFNTNRRGLALEKLKYYLAQDCVDVRQVIVVLDNIEAIPDWPAKCQYVREVLIDYECLKNSAFEYYVKLMISCRPDSYYRLLREDVFNTYPHRNELLMDVPPALDEVFEARFDALVKAHGIDAEDIAEWNRSRSVLNGVAKHLSIDNQTLILSLCNYNIRDSVNLFERILANRTWFQKGWPLQAAFKIQKPYFAPDPTTVMKALVYGNSRIYVEHPLNPVSNILRNSEDSEHDLVPLYILAFLRHRYSHQKNLTYFKYVDLSRLLECVDNIFTINNGVEVFRDVTEQFMECGVLLLSPWDDGRRTEVTLSPRGNALVSMMKSSSLLLEAYRDDLWITNEIVSAELSRTLDETRLFKEIISLLKSYVEKETHCLGIAKESGQLEEYASLFGRVPVTRLLYDGVRESVYAHFVKYVGSSGSAIKEVTHMLNEITRALGGESLG